MRPRTIKTARAALVAATTTALLTVVGCSGSSGAIATTSSSGAVSRSATSSSVRSPDERGRLKHERAFHGLADRLSGFRGKLRSHRHLRCCTRTRVSLWRGPDRDDAALGLINRTGRLRLDYTDGNSNDRRSHA